MPRIAAHTHDLISIGEAGRRLAGADRTTIYRWIARGLLPPPVRIGIARVGIPGHELAAVIAARTRGAGDDAVRELVREIVARRGAP